MKNDYGRAAMSLKQKLDEIFGLAHLAASLLLGFFSLAIEPDSLYAWIEQDEY